MSIMYYNLNILHNMKYIKRNELDILYGKFKELFKVIFAVNYYEMINIYLLQTTFFKHFS